MQQHRAGKRVVGLDIFRGWAIVLMVAYHSCYDLNHFRYIHVDLDRDPLFVYGRYLIVSMFLLSVGMSLYLSHTPAIRWSRMRKRTLLLGAASAIITVVTALQFPHSWVYFGILHFILVASWVGLFFLSSPALALTMAISILLGSLWGWLDVHWLFELLKAPLHLPTRYTEDVVRFFPWFGAVLLGIAMAGYGLHRRLFVLPLFSADHRLHRYLAFAGRHALIIYLLHQPLLFGIFSLLS